MSLPELPEPAEYFVHSGLYWRRVCKPYFDSTLDPKLAIYTADQMRAYALQAVERETAARREAQEQLYAARERHTAEVKGLQAEIGRLQALRPVAMTPSEVIKAFDLELRSSYTDFEAGVRTAETHHHITQKEQDKWASTNTATSISTSPDFSSDCFWLGL